VQQVWRCKNSSTHFFSIPSRCHTFLALHFLAWPCVFKVGNALGGSSLSPDPQILTSMCMQATADRRNTASTLEHSK
jgi:hypothetical protein